MRVLIKSVVFGALVGFALIANADAQTTAPSANDAYASTRPATSPRKLDLSTPHTPTRRVVTHGDARLGTKTINEKSEIGKVDLGGGHLRIDGSRKARDLTQEVTGFDQTPGSSNFRPLVPAQKSGTPPYVGFTLTAPN